MYEHKNGPEAKFISQTRRNWSIEYVLYFCANQIALKNCNGYSCLDIGGINIFNFRDLISPDDFKTMKKAVIALQNKINAIIRNDEASW